MRFLLALAAACALAAAADGPVLLLGPYEAERLIVHREPVRLPPEVARLGLHGEVRVTVEVSPEGVVRRVRLVSGHPLLAGPALQAVRRYRFRPVEVQGRAAAWRGLLRIAVPDAAPVPDRREARAVPRGRPATASAWSRRTSSGSPLRSSRTSRAAPLGHTASQTPQPMQRSQTTSGRPFSSTSASNGHAGTQAPQRWQRPASMPATNPDGARIGTPLFFIAWMPPQQHGQQLQIA